MHLVVLQKQVWNLVWPQGCCWASLAVETRTFIKVNYSSPCLLLCLSLIPLSQFTFVYLAVLVFQNKSWPRDKVDPSLIPQAIQQRGDQQRFGRWWWGPCPSQTWLPCDGELVSDLASCLLLCVWISFLFVPFTSMNYFLQTGIVLLFFVCTVQFDWYMFQCLISMVVFYFRGYYHYCPTHAAQTLIIIYFTVNST